MNDKIKELAEQAGWMMSDEVEGFNTRLEKFAELLIRECACIAFDDWCEGTNEYSSEIAILKHFNIGVE